MPVKTIVVRLALLFAPLFVWQTVELFVLPIDFFTFRFWEALLTQKVYLLPGPFYPNTYLEKYSAGDHESRGPRKKLVRFRSDEYGQRNPSQGHDAYEILVVGDSNIVGSHTDEPDTIRARLESRCNCGVYAYGGGLPSNVLSVLADERFVMRPPRYVVLEFRPGDVEQGNLPIFRPCAASTFPNRALVARLCNTVDARLSHVLAALGLQQHRVVLTYIDRLFKQPAYHALHARLRLTSKVSTAVPKQTEARMRAMLEKSKAALESYREVLDRWGSKLILFSMPAPKIATESIPWYLSELRNQKFHFISIDSSSTPPDILSSWWMKDDSHWREESIEFSADLIWKEIGALSGADKDDNCVAPAQGGHSATPCQ